MDLVHVWCDDRYWSKILHSSIPTPIHDFKVKVTDLELMLKFYVKFLAPHCFQTLWWIWFMFDMMIDIGPKFYTVPSPPPYVTLRSRSWTFMLKFYIKVFRTSLFPNPVVYLFHVCYDDICWSKILGSMIPCPVHDFKVKVIFVLKFVFKFLHCLFLWSLWWIDSFLACW